MLWGYGSAAELEAAGADRLVARTAELATIAKAVFYTSREMVSYPPTAG